MNKLLSAKFLEIRQAAEMAVSRGLTRNDPLRLSFEIHLLFSRMARAVLGQISRDGPFLMDIKYPQRGPRFWRVR